MATIELTSLDDATQHLRGLDDAELMGQSLVQQGAIHAVSYLLTNGCNEAAARQMQASLQDLSARIRAETARRGKPALPVLFPVDQTAMVQAAAAPAGGNHYPPLNAREIHDLTCMHAGAPWPDEVLAELGAVLAIYDQLRATGARPVDPADVKGGA